MDKKGIGYLGLGIGVGAALALLYAPKRGAVTRRYVRAKANSAVGYVKEQGVHLKDRAAGAVDQGKQKIQNAKSTISSALQAGREAYSDVTNAPLP